MVTIQRLTSHTAQQMMELSKSALYLKVGSIGFEQTWMKKLSATMLRI